eukprot:9870190-Heterocapsa_arctica.AAC.1
MATPQNNGSLYQHVYEGGHVQRALNRGNATHVPYVAWLGGAATYPRLVSCTKGFHGAPVPGSVKTQRVVAGVSTRQPREASPRDEM